MHMCKCGCYSNLVNFSQELNLDDVNKICSCLSHNECPNKILPLGKLLFQPFKIMSFPKELCVSKYNFPTLEVMSLSGRKDEVDSVFICNIHLPARSPNQQQSS